MSENGINSYYTSNPKAVLTQNKVFSAPQTLPSENICSNRELDLKYNQLTSDLYQETNNNKKSAKKKFFIGFSSFVAICLSILGISKLIHR